MSAHVGYGQAVSFAGKLALLAFVIAACEIADLDIVEDPAAGGSSSGSEAGGSPSPGGGGGPGGGATPAAGGADGSAGEVASGGVAAGPAQQAGQGGVAEPGGAGAPPLGQGGEGGQPAEPMCAPACEGATPICDEGTCVAPRSCVGLTENCGPALASKCCEQAVIPAGSFKRGYDAVDELDDTNAANISRFSLDSLEVTVGRFRRFVDAGAGHQGAPPALGAGMVTGSPASGWKSEFTDNLAASKAALVAALQCQSGFSTWTNTATAADARPINCVTWYEAQAFCIWDGGRLPTEAEWNYVAAHGSEQRVYPWSSPATSKAISEAQASYYVDNTKQCFGDGVNGCTGADIRVAGSKAGLGFWLQRDLGGNLQEWVLDYYAPAYENPCQDCVQTTVSTYKVLRGGSFATGATGLTASSREMNLPAARASDTGFRCAYGR